MGGCFSVQKGLESENVPVQPPVSPKAAVAEPAPAASTTENVFETPKEASLVDVSETKEEEVKKEAEVVPKEAEVVAEPVAGPVAEEKDPEAVSDVKEEAKVAEVAAASSGTEDKTNDAPAAV